MGRFEALGQLANLETAIFRMQSATDATLCSNSLGLAFLKRSEALREPVDLEKAILVLQRVVDLDPAQDRSNSPDNDRADRCGVRAARGGEGSSRRSWQE